MEKDEISCCFRKFPLSILVQGLFETKLSSYARHILAEIFELTTNVIETIAIASVLAFILQLPLSS